MKTLVVATSNPGKIREIWAALEDLPLRLRSLNDYAPIPPPEETEATFEGNARLKARYYAAKLGEWVLADDSGLEVDALAGAPGVQSARYAGESSNDAANNAKLLHALAGVPDERRTARFRCVICVTGPGFPEGERCFSGAVEGRILMSPHGTEGFGYDPLFFHPALGRTTAEIPLAEKNRISHRGKALALVRTYLLEKLKTEPHSD